MTEVRLYVLMRTELQSMNPGKACAQAAHAANQCVFEARELGGNATAILLAKWEGQSGRGFGTTITLGVNETVMRERISLAKMAGLHAGIVHDPSYPIRDGEVTHLLPLDTCAYVLGTHADVLPILGDLDLMA